jgi:hypothetical protein
MTNTTKENDWKLTPFYGNLDSWTSILSPNKKNVPVNLKLSVHITNHAVNNTKKRDRLYSIKNVYTHVYSVPSNKLNAE